MDPARVRLPLSPESFRVSVPTCSFELARLTVLWRGGGRWTEAKKKKKRERERGGGEAEEIGHIST